jgi:hypothetical protein
VQIAPSAVDKIVLVLSALMVKIVLIMKRTFMLIVLVGIVAGAVLTGCEQKPTETPPAGTNAPAAPAEPAK